MSEEEKSLGSKVYYVGQNKVEAISVVENTDLVGVLFENGRTEDFTTEQWAGVRSDEPYSDGEISIRKHEALMVRILKEMVKSRVTLGEHDWLLGQVSTSIGENYRKSIAKMYNVTNTEKVMLAQIDETLKAE